MARPVALITGSTRGIGLAMAEALARSGYDIVVTGKTTTPHPKLPGTLSSAAAQIQKLGAQVLAFPIDLRDSDKISELFDAIEKKFGRLDLLVNNASAIDLTPTEQLPIKRFDLLQQVNGRASFACTQGALPLLKQAPSPRVVTLCPPISLESRWFQQSVAYTMSKYAMSLTVLGFATEFRTAGIAVHGLWPKTLIATAAVQFQISDKLLPRCRKPEVVADALLALLKKDPLTNSGQFFLDEDLLKDAGCQDFTPYACDPSHTPLPDLYTDDFQW